jgi:hypothetical protein
MRTQRTPPLSRRAGHRRERHPYIRTGAWVCTSALKPSCLSADTLVCWSCGLSNYNPQTSRCRSASRCVLERCPRCFVCGLRYYLVPHLRHTGASTHQQASGSLAGAKPIVSGECYPIGNSPIVPQPTCMLHPTNSQRKAYGPLPQAVHLTFASRSPDLALAARRPVVVIAPAGALLVAPAGIWPW